MAIQQFIESYNEYGLDSLKNESWW